MYPVVAALVAAEKLEGMGKDRRWVKDNPEQMLFLERHFAPCRHEIESIPEIKSSALWLNSVPNDPFRPFETESKLDLNLRWLKAGTKDSLIAADEKTYPALRLESSCIRFHWSSPHPYPVAKIATSDEKTKVYLTELDAEPQVSGLFDLALTLQEERSKSIEEALRRMQKQYAGLIFPMIDLIERPDISWIERIWTQSDIGYPAAITRAEQETKLRANEIGVRIESRVRMSGMLIGSADIAPPIYIVKRPFLFWVVREGLSQPLFIGFIGVDNWKAPKSLD